MNPQITLKSNAFPNVFDKYFREISRDEKPVLVETGPYISISRNFGCMANGIAQKLMTELNFRNKASGKNKQWSWINKVILEKSAKALQLSPSRIEYVFHSKHKSVMDEIVGAMSARYYKSDIQIRKTIREVIRSMAQSGHVIIVGRGGVAFAHDNPHSLHIKLIAPIEWRVERIIKNYHKTEEEALHYIHEIDRERKFLIDSFVGHKTDDSVFDVIFNRQSMTDEEIIASIIRLMEMKKLTD